MVLSTLATSKNVLVFYSIIGAPPFVFTNFAEDSMVTIPDVDIVKMTVGCDGTVQRSAIAALVEGDFTLQPNSPGVNFVYNLQAFVNNTGVVPSGILTIVYPSMGIEFSYPETSFISGPKGIESAQEAKAVKIKWKGLLPNKASIGPIAQSLVSSFFSV